MQWHKAILIGTLSWGGAALAVPPATQPAEISALIRQLGDDSYSVRQSAIRRLREIGKPAIPALQDAAKSDDAEIQLRADELVKELQRPPIPFDVPQPPVPRNGGIYPMSYRESERNGIRIVDVSENGRSIHIERYPTGVQMSISGQINGQPATREYRFRELADLRQLNPEAYALYLNYIHNDNKLRNGVQANVQVQIQAGGFIQVIRPPFGRMIPLPPMQVAVPVDNDELDRLELKLLDQMRQQHLAPREQDQVTGLLQQLRGARPPVIDPARIQQQMEEYNRISDDLRKRLDELKLPDPGNLLPPAAGARLGISTQTDDREGLVVSHVLPNSRAARLDLRENDLIQKVNGNPIVTAEELRKVLSQTRKGLIVEGVRDGKPFKLEEK